MHNWVTRLPVSQPKWRQIAISVDYISAAEALGADGPLAQTLPGYQPRTSQIDLARTIEEVIVNEDTLVAEAGTGIGKTFAYLAPILLSNGKAIISTGTKQLQDQLFHKDLPALEKAIKMDLDCVMLKGRANYLCLHRLKQATSSLADSAHENFIQIKTIDKWSSDTKSGDIAEFKILPEDHRVWPKVTSNVDNCIGQECSDYKQCFVVKARQAAQAADVVVINHHLFCADLTLRETGFAELLPDADTIVIDEAHRLPEVASLFFGKSFSSRQLNELAKDVRAEVVESAPDMLDLTQLALSLPAAVARFRYALGQQGSRQAWRPMLAQEKVKASMDDLDEVLQELVSMLDAVAERSQGLAATYKRCLMTRDILRGFGEPVDEIIHWYETTRQGFVLHATPLAIDQAFTEHRQAFSSAWVFTSATLAVDGDFSHFCNRLGITDAITKVWGSPFNYEENALLYLPENMPEPAAQDYTSRVCELALPLIEGNAGGTFMLFTSHRALKLAAEHMRAEGLQPLVQGEAPRQTLLEDFRQAGNGLLLGTSSFWEGVDVRGAALSCVIIDKLPFASPGDPVLEARLQVMRKAGSNPFMDYQLPEAVISLKQGAGRLIRDAFDTGLLVICDPRIKTKPYGRKFLASLPPMPITDVAADAEHFLTEIAVEE